MLKNEYWYLEADTQVDLKTFILLQLPNQIFV